MGDFFDLTLSDALGVYLDADAAKKSENMDAYKQGLNQGAAIAAAELVNQQAETEDVTDSQYAPQNLLANIDKRWLYLGGGALVLFLGYKALK